MSRKPDVMHLLTMARPASLDRGSRISTDDILIKAPIETPGEPNRRPPHPRRHLLTALRLTAVATAFAVAAVVLVRNADVERTAPSPEPARTVLLAAAERVEAENPATGRYWHTTGQSMAVGEGGEAPVGMEPKLVRYQVTCTHEVWIAKSDRDPSWLVVTAQSGKPLTKTDEETWRQQGAYRIGGCEGVGVPSVGGTLPAPPFAMRLDDKRAPEVSYPQAGATHVTTKEVMNLPTDVMKLRKVLQEWARRGGYPADEESLYAQTTSLLSQLPTTPAQRAALYRLLAGLSRVKNIGATTDPIGRAGTGIELSGSGRQIIIDETSGRLLAAQERSTDRAGALTSWTALTASGWTEARPALPSTILFNGG
ncbi:CU044_5270 family protein [Nonomuraea sp. NPDC049028]|uniref:CU044_5270 family protein n=1 Tax=Nonomuraea sp. NPDC049028 TaxID=3364348 RepID=UPI003721396D